MTSPPDTIQTVSFSLIHAQTPEGLELGLQCKDLMIKQRHTLLNDMIRQRDKAIHQRNRWADFATAEAIIIVTLLGVWIGLLR